MALENVNPTQTKAWKSLTQHVEQIREVHMKSLFQKQKDRSPYGVIGMAGNVAEMTSKPGTAKGGSWRTCGYDLQIEAPDPFEGDVNPKAFVGFRPVFVIVE